jgi:uncharacterized protein (TIGR02391 family)
LPRAQQHLDSFNSWAGENQAFLTAVWLAFNAEGSWPKAADLARALYTSGVRLNVLEIARQLPAPLGRLDAPDQRIVLSIRGLAYVPDGRSLASRYVELVKTCVERYGTPDQDASVTSAEFSELLDIEPMTASKLEKLCQNESWALNSAGGSAGDMRFALSEYVVFNVEEVETLDDYLDAQARAWWPEPTLADVVVPTSIPQSAADLVEPATTPPTLHPLIADAAASLLAGAHHREAVDRAVRALLQEVRRRCNADDLDGESLINFAFNPKNPALVVADIATATGRNIQRGTHLLALGIVAAIRNPSAHALLDPSADEAGEQLAILSFVARRLEESVPAESGYTSDQGGHRLS